MKVVRLEQMLRLPVGYTQQNIKELEYRNLAYIRELVEYLDSLAGVPTALEQPKTFVENIHGDWFVRTGQDFSVADHIKVQYA